MRDVEWVEDFIFLFLMLISKSRSRFSCMIPGIERFFLNLLWAVENVLWKWGGGVIVLRSWVRRICYCRITWDITFWLNNLKLEQAVLLVVISKSCLQWFEWYWRGVKLKKVATKYCVHGLSVLLLGIEEDGRGAGIKIVYTFLEIVVGRFKWRNMWWPSKEEEVLYK